MRNKKDAIASTPILGGETAGASPQPLRTTASALPLRTLALVLLIAAAAPPARILLREQAWTPPSPGRVEALTQTQGECITTATPEIEIGRALFRTPVLIGGPAARAGLSCHACHTDGGANTHFMLPELTDRPGAADVTSEWSSHVRGDGVANPRDIPDLAGAGARAAFGQGREPSLERFMHGVVVEEFQGEEPPPAAFAALVAYVRALDAAACPATPAPVSLASAAEDVRRTLAAAQHADAATASLLLYAAQDQIGRVAERLPPAAFKHERRALAALARELGGLRETPAALGESGWRARFDGAIARIARREDETYFNAETLRAALGD
ncbi:MAG: hypothetical protein AB7P07_00980 [Hyphomonadaceae bacterium]